MIQRRFDAVVQQTIPEHFSKLIKKLSGTSGMGFAGHQHRPETPEKQQQAGELQKHSFVPCPLCLGTGANAAQLSLLCSRCRGRGLVNAKDQ